MGVKYVVLSVFVLLFGMGFAQKIKIKDGYALVDGEKYLQWKKVSSVESSLMGLGSSEEEIFASWLNYVDPNKITSANPEGKVRWVELYFTTLELRCEVRSSTRKELVRMIIDNSLYEDGVLSKENVEKFVKKYGTRFSDNRPGGNVKVIINNN